MRWVVLCLAACSHPSGGGPDPSQPDAGATPDAPAGCVAIDDATGTTVTVTVAAAAGEYALVLNARAASETKWSEPGNEALVLEVLGSVRGLIGHLIVH